MVRSGMPRRGRIPALLALLVLVAACAPESGNDLEPTPAPSPTSATPSPPPSATASASDTPGALGSAPTGPTETAIVLSITDGDTIRVDRGHGSEPVRYIGMNTPEAGDPGGDEATAANAELVEGREVVLERDVSETDQFGRLLRYAWLHDGSTWLLVNLELVRRGYAQVATYPPDVRYVDLLTAAQSTARARGVGLWAGTPEPTAPPAAVPSPEPTEPPSNDCHPSYDPCLPIVGDLDCPEVRAMGLAPVHVIGPDEYRLDGDHDGIGCE